MLNQSRLGFVGDIEHVYKHSLDQQIWSHKSAKYNWKSRKNRQKIDWSIL